MPQTDPWWMIRDDLAHGWDAVVSGILAELDGDFGVPRDINLVNDALPEILPSGRFYVYGAGSHSMAILDTLRRCAGSALLGFLDRRAEDIGSLTGLPVLTPDEAVRRGDADFILLSHVTHEADMVETLQALGFPGERIVPIYGNPRLRWLSRDRHLTRILEEIGERPIDTVIVRCNRSVIIEERVLAEVFDPERTLIVFAGRNDWVYNTQVFRSVDTQQSIPVLTGLLQRLSPAVVYLSTILDHDVLAIPVRRACPDAFLIHEIHDWWHLYENDFLADAFDMHPRRAQRARIGEYYSGCFSDLVVSNRDGPLWPLHIAEFKAPYLSYFVGFPEADNVLDTPMEPMAAGDRMRLLYAGNLPPPYRRLHFEVDFTFLPLFEALATRGDTEIHLFNNSHQSALGDQSYAAYLWRYAGPDLFYHPRVPAAELMGLMAGFDFGWHCMPQRRRIALDQAMAVTHRFTGYLRGGLPVIVDSGWRFLADLVREHGAGLVLDDPTADAVVEAARSADRSALRAGVRRLTAAMNRHNANTISRLQAVVGARMPSAGRRA